MFLLSLLPLSSLLMLMHGVRVPVVSLRSVAGFTAFTGVPSLCWRCCCCFYSCCCFDSCYCCHTCCCVMRHYCTDSTVACITDVACVPAVAGVPLVPDVLTVGGLPSFAGVHLCPWRSCCCFRTVIFSLSE
jgi:hypothetical protein